MKFNDLFIQKSAVNQLLATLCVNILTFSHGSIIGWVSPFLPILQSSDLSPLESGAITNEEASWISAIVCIGGIIGNFLFGFLSEKFGRKIAILFLVVPHITFWISIYFGKYVYHLYIARVAAGMTGGGIFVTLPIYLAEISESHIRGTFGSSILLSMNLGILLGFITGANLNYFLIPLIMLMFPFAYVIGVCYLPETPQHLIRINELEKAELAFKFYRNIAKSKSLALDDKYFAEFKAMKLMNFKDENSKSNRIKITDFTTKIARKALIIGLILMVLNQLSGCFALLNYTASIFAESGSDLSPNTSAIVVAGIQIFGTYTSTILVDRAGRKILLIISEFGTSLGLISMGLYSYFSKHDYDVSEFGWIPIVSLSFVIFIASLGILTLPFVVLAEILPQKIRGPGCTICTCVISIIAFIILKTFPFLITTINLYGVMFLFGGCSMIGAFFIITVLPETKGKNLSE